MKKVAIYGQSYSVSSEKEINTLIQVLEKNNIEFLLEKEFHDLLLESNSIPKAYSTFSHFKDLSSDFDFMFTIGGDGTILRAVTFVRDLNIPILGINTGRLGFLATVKKDKIESSVELLLNNAYTIHERSLLEVEVTPESKDISKINFALNDVTVARRNTTSMIGVKTFLNEEYLTNYWADGLIIATPTGSTGYSLSCGGPVVLPDSKNLVITPIAPHNLNARPIIISDDTSIQLEVSARESKYLVSLDSRITTVPENTKVNIKRADFTIKSVLLKNQSFLKTLRGKLLWGEDTRNNPKQ